MNYNWTVNSECTVENVLEAIASYNGMTDAELSEFIDDVRHVNDPRKLPFINEAVARIRQAIDNNEQIVIAGDYDCDGVTATTVMVLGLTQFTPHVDWIIPDRVKDGYGLSKRMVDECVLKNAQLIITVDNGISAHESIAYAESLGIDVVVTDHHQFLTDKLPCSIVVDPFVNNDYPLRGICGCMVAYKVMQVLDPQLHKRPVHSELVSLVAIATVADAMQLVGENRVFVHHGLSMISRTTNSGLRCLLDELQLSNKQLSASDIGFKIAPCINAAGRLADAGMCVRLLLTDDFVEPIKISKKMVAINETRKAIQRDCLTSIDVSDDEKFIVKVVDDNVPGGMLGLVAGNLATTYQRPCFVLKERAGQLAGSGRTVHGYNISRCFINNPDIASGGGHAEACGVKVLPDAIEDFRARCADDYDGWLASADESCTTPSLGIVGRITLADVTCDFVKTVAAVGPFGNGNAEPLFCVTGVKVVEAKVVGKLHNTVKLTVTDGTSTVTAIAFNAPKDKYFDELGEPKVIDIAFVVSVNEWRGVRTPQLLVTDLRVTEFDEF